MPYKKLLRNRLHGRETRAPQDIPRELLWVCQLLDRSRNMQYKRVRIDRSLDRTCELPRVFTERSRGSASCSIVLATCHTKGIPLTSSSIAPRKPSRVFLNSSCRSATSLIILERQLAGSWHWSYPGHSPKVPVGLPPAPSILQLAVQK